MASVKILSLTTAVLLLLICLLPGCSVPEEEYSRVERELEATRMELGQTTDELAQRNTEVERLEKELASLEEKYDLLHDDYEILKNKYNGLEALHTANSDELEQSLVAPYTAISGRRITCAWKDRSGKLHKWTWPVDSYRAWIEHPKPNETLLLKYGDENYTMVDFRPYVRTGFFSEVIPKLYRQYDDHWAFAREVFNLVSQLTVYSEDSGEVPRWPVETLTEAGGDCEDLSILFASLLKAAPYPYRLSLVYMDEDNLTDPQQPNHVIVKVETDDWTALVECSNVHGWNYYNKIFAWFLEV